MLQNLHIQNVQISKNKLKIKKYIYQNLNIYSVRFVFYAVSIIVIISSLGQLYIVKHNKTAAAATAAINVLSVASHSI